MSLWISWSRNSAAVANVENGTTTAPIRAAASMATTNAALFGCSTPTWVPLPAPSATSPRARSADCCSAWR